jgi:hypothetical protein
VTGFRPPPERHWRPYGAEPLPPASEALNQPFRAFPSWFLRIECERCGKTTMLNEAHTGQRRVSLKSGQAIQTSRGQRRCAHCGSR